MSGPALTLTFAEVAVPPGSCVTTAAYELFWAGSAVERIRVDGTRGFVQILEGP
jgi:phosphoenolpyruvate synthase/pyruvate phosphate dikinase